MSENKLFGEDMEANLCDRLLTENDRLYQRIGTLETALQAIIDFPRDDTSPEVAHFGIRDIARAAIAKAQS